MCVVLTEKVEGAGAKDLEAMLDTAKSEDEQLKAFTDADINAGRPLAVVTRGIAKESYSDREREREKERERERESK